MPDAALVLGAALLLDGLLGEPPGRLHPVVWMGTLTRMLTRRAPRAGLRALVAGAAIALAVPALFAISAGLVERAIAPWPPLALALGAVLLKPTFALRALGRAALTVHAALAAQDLGGARAGLASLCSRDARSLEPPELIAATVESVAENASDSFVAPLFYYALLGLPGAVAYRAVNTLDAMIGYHGEYEHLGKAAARLDDLLNLVPARLTAGLLLAGGWLLGQDVRRGAAILARDGGRTESPNAGRPMSTMAGLLGVALEKRGHYRLGDAVAPLVIGTIDAAWRIVLVAAALAATLVLLTLWARHV